MMGKENKKASSQRNRDSLGGRFKIVQHHYGNPLQLCKTMRSENVP